MHTIVVARAMSERNQFAKPQWRVMQKGKEKEKKLNLKFQKYGDFWDRIPLVKKIMKYTLS